MNFEDRFKDLGNFSYRADGFTYQFDTGRKKVKWQDIERLIAYKADLMTTDEIRLDIVCNDFQTTITEETPGWYQFVEKTKTVFPSLADNWDNEITQPAFKTNLIVLYDRSNAGQKNNR